MRRPGIAVHQLDDWVDGASQEVRRGKAHIFHKAPVSNDMMAANEFICARLGAAMGLPMPAGEVAEDVPGVLGWATLEVEGAIDYAPPDPAEVVASEPDLAAGCVVFDVWVDNRDRDERNIIFHRDIGLWLIDHEMALGGPATDLDDLHAAATRPTPMKFFRTVGPERQRIEAWVRSVQRLPTSVVTETLKEARKRQLITARQRDALQRFLSLRRRSLPVIVAASLGWHDEDTVEGGLL